MTDQTPGGPGQSDDGGRPTGATQFFKPLSDAESAGATTSDASGTNAMRALILGMQLSDSHYGLTGLEDEIAAVGSSLEVTPVHGWGERIESMDRSETLINNLGIDSIPPVGADAQEVGYSSARISLWTRLLDEPTNTAVAFAWLRLVMASETTVEGVAAAAALSHWRRPSKNDPVPEPLELARRILKRARETDQPVAREIALAATGAGIGRGLAGQDEEDYPNAWKTDPHEGLSTLIHGTFAWTGDWWYPGGDFHKYVKAGLRPNVYAGGAPFSWSGAYNGKNRSLAAQRLARWVTDVGSGRLDCIFAHSYGGGIALMSSAQGARYETAVLMSTPVHRNYDIEWRNIGRAVSVRLRFDLVLAAARARQRFGANVDEYIVPLFPWQHGITHTPAFWDEHDVARHLGL